MSPFAKAVDAGFSRLGQTATLEQGALSRNVKVIPAEEDALSEFKATPVRQMGGTYEISQVEFDGFSKGALLTIGAKQRKVQDFECRDRLRLKYVLFTVAP